MELKGGDHRRQYMSQACIDGDTFDCNMIGCMCSCHDEKSEQMKGKNHSDGV